MANFKAFGRELVHGNFGNAIRELTAPNAISKSLDLNVTEPITPYAYRNGMFFFGTGSPETAFTYSGTNSSLTAYTQCPELQSIINRRALAHTNGKRWIMKEFGKGKGGEDKGVYATKCRTLLANPNPFQSGQQFETMLKIYVDLFGWCLLMPIYAAPYFAKLGLSEASALFLVPPYMLEYHETGAWHSQKTIKDLFSEITLTVGGVSTPLDLDQVVVIKDMVPRMYSGTIDGTGGMAELLIFPESRVRAQSKPISNIISAYESRGELIRFAGSQGIVSPNPGTGGMVAMPLTEPQQKELQAKFKMQYGIGAKQSRYIISPQPLSWQQMGRPTRDLMLFEEIEADVRALCNAWPYPWKLLAESGSSLNGTEVDALTRNLYQDAIIPEASSINGQLAKAFKAQENGTRWDMDFNHVPAMQEDEKLKAETRKVAGDAAINEFEKGMIMFNRALELIGEDTVEWGNIYYHEYKKLFPNEPAATEQQPAGTDTETGEES